MKKRWSARVIVILTFSIILVFLQPAESLRHALAQEVPAATFFLPLRRMY